MIESMCCMIPSAPPTLFRPVRTPHAAPRIPSILAPQQLVQICPQLRRHQVMQSLHVRHQ